jgi:hypothetical protein
MRRFIALAATSLSFGGAIGGVAVAVASPAGVVATGRAIRTGNAGRRAKNVAIGRALGRSGFWSRLWK